MEFSQLRVAFSVFSKRGGIGLSIRCADVCVLLFRGITKSKKKLLSHLDGKLNLLPLHKTILFVLATGGFNFSYFSIHIAYTVDC